MSRKTTVVALALLLALASAGCGGDSAELPDSVLDVTGDRFAGKVATAMRQLEGEEATEAWLRALVANKPRTYANNNAIVEAVSRGEVEMGLVNHYYNDRFQQESPGTPSRNHSFAGNDVGALVIPSTASVLAGSDKTEEATRFLRFLLSEESQRYVSDQTYEYPLVAGVPAAPGLAPLASLHSPDDDVDAPGGGLEGTVELIRSSGAAASAVLGTALAWLLALSGVVTWFLVVRHGNAPT